MADRQRVRVGRQVLYRPTDAEATTGGGNAGDAWTAKVVDVQAGTVNLLVFEADGTTIAKTAVVRGQGKGQFDLLGAGTDTV